MNHNVVTAVVVLGIVAVVAIVLVADRQDGSGASGGEELQGETLAGAAFDLADLRGKPVVVNFFASWCGPCNSEAPDLVAFAKAHPEVAFVGVDTGDALAEGRAFVEQYGVDYPVVFDGDRSLGGQWGVEGIPTTVFLDASGVEKERIVGATDAAGFEEALTSVQ